MLSRIFITALVALILNQTQAQQLPSTKPNAAQQAMIKRGYGMFIHFGINTFADTEWSDGTLPIEKYNPTQLDPDQWVSVAKASGLPSINEICVIDLGVGI